MWRRESYKCGAQKIINVEQRKLKMKSKEIYKCKKE